MLPNSPLPAALLPVKLSAAVLVVPAALTLSTWPLVLPVATMVVLPVMEQIPVACGQEKRRESG